MSRLIACQPCGLTMRKWSLSLYLVLVAGWATIRRRCSFGTWYMGCEKHFVIDRDLSHLEATLCNLWYLMHKQGPVTVKGNIV
jgi:hypothetical protein